MTSRVSAPSSLAGFSPHNRARARIVALEHLLEGLIKLPLIGRRVGLDAIIGLAPGVGEAATAALGLYLIWEARNLGASRGTLLRMLANVGVDTAIGSVPIAGDLFDVFFRSNSRNLKLVKRLLDER
ncbi:DUF4112 domain-containing protein [Sandarakinorhabdus limnophila]|uniref:DUF4112 domain-containing protein n=1 Tax=Sandarakinorhabdus limnophila TaxID=210512 RepID=UPI0031382D53